MRFAISAASFPTRRALLALVLLAVPPGATAVLLASCGGSSGRSSPSADAALADGTTTDVLVTPDATGDASPGGGEGGPVQCPDYNPNKNVYWGDLHTHTALSGDAYGWGNRNFPHDAYRFATGAQTAIAAGASPPGPLVTIDRPLDWDAVTDHSEWLGATWGCGTFPDGGPFDPTSPYFDSMQCQTYRTTGPDLDAIVAAAGAAVAYECDGGHQDDPSCATFTQSVWQLEIQAAHDAYQPCTFTSLVAYEWTKETSGATLHQNVIFSSESVPVQPLDSAEYTTTGDLWSGLDQQCVADAGCEVLTIPHNGNLSEGMAYQLPAGVEASQQMNRYQRLTEIHQHKGDSECHAGDAATDDPTCDFEHVPEAGKGSDYPQNFVRHALSAGIQAYQAMRDAGEPAVDPMQMGVEGATDDHNGIPGYVVQEGWQGHVGSTDDTPSGRLKNWYHNPGGLTGAWAEQNTRESIFAALQRRETFGTSGPRIVLRFYEVGGTNDTCGADGGGGGFPGNVIAAGGVPMGGTMPAGSTSANFVVSALKDATDLAEVDIIRGRVVGGAIDEAVIRFTPASGTGIWSGGSVCLQWTDPVFSPGNPAYYYVRVLQQPTWRWSHYDCQADPTDPACAADAGVDVMVQQRAWSSPIWWLP
jgi:Protein of unknown function (DUF3604)